MYLILYIGCAVSFLQLFRYGQRLGANVFAIAAVNYVLAALLSAGRWQLLGADALLAPAIGFGIFNGVCYWLHIVVVLRCFATAGVGITTAVMHSATVAPVLVAWWAWGEVLTVSQWVAVALLPVAMFLMRPGGRAPGRLTSATDLWLVLNLLLAGSITTVHKAAEVYLAAAAQPGYNLVLFALAAISSVAYVAHRRLLPTRQELRIGGAIGIVNSLTLTVLMLALGRVPASVFYPLASSLVVVTNLFVSRQLWHERLARRQLVGVGVAIIIVALN